jgi:hypothetical protein
LELLKESKEGLTVSEIAKALNTENIESIRMILNRDLIKKDLVIELDDKKNGCKLYKEKSEEKKGEISEVSKELLKENLESNLSLMQFFEENKSKLQKKAFEKKEVFDKIIEVIDKTEKVLEGDKK